MFKKEVMFIIFAGVLIVIFLSLAHYYIRLPNPQLPGAKVTIGTTTFSVEVASTTLARVRGLSGRDGLGEGDGMFFLFSSPGSYGFWMKDMKFPIDIVWINNSSVVGFAENAAPEPGKTLWNLIIYNPPGPVDRVLEVNSGDVKKYGIKAGDNVSISGF
jgi:uncharacterized membrane protein (UPF0127 family)